MIVVDHVCTSKETKYIKNSTISIYVNAVVFIIFYLFI